MTNGAPPARSPIETIADALRREIKPLGIGVSVIQAGFVASPIIEKTEQMDQDILAKTNQQQQLREKYPMLAQKVYTEQISLDSMASMSVVEDAVLDAFQNSHPKIRYVVGSVPTFIPTRVLVALLHFLPHHIIDLFE